MIVVVIVVALERAPEDNVGHSQPPQQSSKHRALSVTFGTTINTTTMTNWRDATNCIVDHPTIDHIAATRALNARQRIAFEMVASTLLARLATPTNEFRAVAYNEIGIEPSPELLESSPTHVPRQSLMIVTGPAGTGKSHVISAVRELAARHGAHDAVAVVAFTAAAAIKVGGMTFHKFLGMSSNTSVRAREAAASKAAQRPLHKIRLLIFEEVKDVVFLVFFCCLWSESTIVFDDDAMDADHA
jgi:hypothetical protein